MARRGYSPEFRQRVIDLVEAGRPVAAVATELGISGQSIYTWRRQARIDAGIETGMTTAEHAELAALRKRVRELETELAIHRRATELGRGTPTQKQVRGHQSDGRGGTPRRAGVRPAGGVGVGLLRLAGSPALGAVDPPRLAERRHRGGSCRLPADLRRRPGSCRAHHGPRHRGVPSDRRDPDATGRAAGHLGAAKVPQGPQRGDRGGSRGPRLRPSRARPAVGHRHHRAPDARGQGLLRGGAGHLQPPRRRSCPHERSPPRTSPGPAATQPSAALATAPGLDTAEPPAAFPAWSPPDTSIIEVLRRPLESGQFTSWAFTQRAVDSGLLPSMGSVGDCFDNAMVESFWSRMQVELLDRKRWRTRIELANAIFEYLEIWHNRQRRHTSLGMLTPIEFEARHQHKPAA